MTRFLALRRPLLLLAVFACADARAAMTLTCHYTYGGETHTLSAAATQDPYRVPAVTIGSYFLIRPVLEAGTAAKIYTYANRDEGPVPIHVAEFPLPLASRQQAPGFTGYQTVYEPVRDGELQYWCAAMPGRR